VTTTAASTGMLHSPRHIFFAQWVIGLGFLFSAVLVGPPKKRCAPGIILGLLLLSLVTMLGCGGGSKPTPTPTPTPTPVAATPAGTYTITVNATSGASTSSTGFTLTVQ
jgi:hypothetical protein